MKSSFFLLFCWFIAEWFYPVVHLVFPSWKKCFFKGHGDFLAGGLMRFHGVAQSHCVRGFFSHKDVRRKRDTCHSLALKIERMRRANLTAANRSIDSSTEHFLCPRLSASEPAAFFEFFLYFFFCFHFHTKLLLNQMRILMYFSCFFHICCFLP